MDFSPIDRSDFRSLKPPKSDELFAKIDYEVQLIFDGIRLTYRLIVPEGGRWWNWDGELESQHDRNWGQHPYQAEATMENISAAFDVSGYRVRRGEAHADKPSSSLKANTASMTSAQHDRAQIARGQQTGSHSPSAQLLSQRPMTTRKARPRQRPCGHCLRSRQKLMCEVLPKETRCTRCVRLHLRCKP